MSHSYCTNLVHCVFSTKDRTPSIPAERQEQLWAYLDGIANNHHMPLLAVGGIANHVHLLVAIPQTVTVASAINRFKANSSRWLHEHGSNFGWQKGYAAFSVSPSQVPAVKEYIRTQAKHHVKHTFRRRIHFIVAQMRRGIRSQARLRVGVAPLALPCFFQPFPPLPRWANEFRTSGAGRRMPAQHVLSHNRSAPPELAG